MEKKTTKEKKVVKKTEKTIPEQIEKKAPKKTEKVDFDLSLLSLADLIKTYEEIIDFMKFLEEKKIVIEVKTEDE